MITSALSLAQMEKGYLWLDRGILIPSILLGVWGSQTGALGLAQWKKGCIAISL